MDDDDAVTTLVTEILRKALWNITYHEYELKKAHSTKALVIALLKRVEISMTYAEAKAICDEIEDENFFKSFNELNAKVFSLYAHLICVKSRCVCLDWPLPNQRLSELYKK